MHGLIKPIAVEPGPWAYQMNQTTKWCNPLTWNTSKKRYQRQWYGRTHQPVNGEFVTTLCPVLQLSSVSVLGVAHLETTYHPDPRLEQVPLWLAGSVLSDHLQWRVHLYLLSAFTLGKTPWSLVVFWSLSVTYISLCEIWCVTWRL